MAQRGEYISVTARFRASEETRCCVKTLSKVIVTHAEAHFFPDNKLFLFIRVPRAHTPTIAKSAFGAEISCKLTPYRNWKMQLRLLRWSLERSREASWKCAACLCRVKKEALLRSWNLRWNPLNILPFFFSLKFPEIHTLTIFPPSHWEHLGFLTPSKATCDLPFV